MEDKHLYLFVDKVGRKIKTENMSFNQYATNVILHLITIGRFDNVTASFKFPNGDVSNRYHMILNSKYELKEDDTEALLVDNANNLYDYILQIPHAVSAMDVLSATARLNVSISCFDYDKYQVLKQALAANSQIIVNQATDADRMDEGYSSTEVDNLWIAINNQLGTGLDDRVSDLEDDVADLQENKQDKLTAGYGIVLSSDNVISVSGVIGYDDTEIRGEINTLERLVNGHTIRSDVPANAVFTDTKYTAGSNVYIAPNNTISVTGLSNVAISGDYYDLNNTPHIPVISVSNSGSSSILANYITLDGTEYMIGGSGTGSGGTTVEVNVPDAPDTTLNNIRVNNVIYGVPQIPSNISYFYNDSGYLTDSSTAIVDINSVLMTKADASEISSVSGVAYQNSLDIATINSYIPAATSTTNTLADKDFVNSSIATNTGTFRGTYSSVTALETAYPTANNNDYAIVTTTSSVTTIYNRYKYDGAAWVFEYAINDTGFTPAQEDALNSGITSTILNNITSSITQITSDISSISAVSVSSTGVSTTAVNYITIGSDEYLIGGSSTAGGGSSVTANVWGETPSEVLSNVKIDGILYDVLSTSVVLSDTPSSSSTANTLARLTVGGVDWNIVSTTVGDYVSVSAVGTSTTAVNYITINNEEYLIGGSGTSSAGTSVTANSSATPTNVLYNLAIDNDVYSVNSASFRISTTSFGYNDKYILKAFDVNGVEWDISDTANYALLSGTASFAMRSNTANYAANVPTSTTQLANDSGYLTSSSTIISALTTSIQTVDSSVSSISADISSISAALANKADSSALVGLASTTYVNTQIASITSVGYSTTAGYAETSGTATYAVSAGISRSIDYSTTLPSAINTNGLKVIVSTTEPSTKYDGYIYIITST